MIRITNHWQRMPAYKYEAKKMWFIDDIAEITSGNSGERQVRFLLFSSRDSSFFGQSSIKFTFLDFICQVKFKINNLIWCSTSMRIHNFIFLWFWNKTGGCHFARENQGGCPRWAMCRLRLCAVCFLLPNYNLLISKSFAEPNITILIVNVIIYVVFSKFWI